MSVICIAEDAEGDTLTFYWTTTRGTLTQNPSENHAVLLTSLTYMSSQDTAQAEITVSVRDEINASQATMQVSIVNGDLWEDTGEPFIDEMDSSGSYDGVYDAQEPWIDWPNEFEVNNIGVYDPWDPFSDLNANGYWDDGEKWFDLPSGVRVGEQPRGAPMLNNMYDSPNGEFDEYELFTQHSEDTPSPDPRMPVVYSWQDLLTADVASFDWLTDSPGSPLPNYLEYQEGLSTWSDRNEDGVFDIPASMNDSPADLWFDTGEPFIDTPDLHGEYNHEWDPGEIFLDLPSGYTQFGPRMIPTQNGMYDEPNGGFDEYELFTIISSTDSRLPVAYTWANILEEFPPAGEPEWMLLPPLPGSIPGYLARLEGHSTWIDRNGNGLFDIP